MTEPDDRALEQYLTGNSPLSRRYREAGGETAPPELDEAILAQARRAARLRPLGINRWLTPLALAASVMLGINLGWNVYKAAPAPGETAKLNERMETHDPSVVPAPAPSAADAPRAAAPAPRAERKAPAAPPVADAASGSAAEARGAELDARRRAESARQAEEQERVQAQELRAGAARERALMQKQAEPLQRDALAGASADRAAAAPAAAAPLGEPEKIDRLINAIGNLSGATFIRNGREYGATEAAKHLQLKREKAGDRVRTADDFIRLCASHSYLSGEAYLIRFADGRTRTAEDVLREELARIEHR